MDTMVARAVALLQAASASPDLPAFAIRSWDGTELASRPGEAARFTAVFKHPDAFTRLFARPDLKSMGEAYLRDDLDIEGDIEAIYGVVEAIERLFGDGAAGADGQSEPIAFTPPSGSTMHARERDGAAVRYHYDLSNHAYGLITGPTRMYSSAYFHDEAEDLESAQRRKVERCCRKLDLREGDALLDIGCGWGGMMLHAVRDYQVRAHGVTVSREQAALVAERIASEAVAERCSVELVDYRDIDESRPFDKIVSLGMIEHVGLRNLPAYFDKAHRLLKPRGRFLVQGVATHPSSPRTEVNAFAAAYLFPDTEMPHLVQFLQAAEGAGFEIRDVENMREHYALTHRRWRLNLERHRQAITDEIGAERYRALRLLYSYSTHHFLHNRVAVYQILLSRPAGPDIVPPLQRPL